MAEDTASADSSVSPSRSRQRRHSSVITALTALERESTISRNGSGGPVSLSSTDFGFRGYNVTSVLYTTERGRVALAGVHLDSGRRALLFTSASIDPGEEDATRRAFAHEVLIAGLISHSRVLSSSSIAPAAEGFAHCDAVIAGAPPAGTLPVRQWLAREGALSAAEALQVALSVCDVLCSFHANGIVHCGLTLDAIWYDRESHLAFVSDLEYAVFARCSGSGGQLGGHRDSIGGNTPRARSGSHGLWRSDASGLELGASTRSHNSMAPIGCAETMAPEQTGRTAASIDARADLYGLGCCMYEMLTGRLPFECSDLAEMLHAHMARQPAPLRSLAPSAPAAVEKLVARLLAKDRAARYQSVHGLAVDLEKIWRSLESGDSSAGDENFTLGSSDVSHIFQVSDGFYGRVDEVAAVDNALHTLVDAVAARVVTISIGGSPGVGKTTLCEYIRQSPQGQRVFFAHGKFEQFSRAVPLSAITAALAELAGVLVAQAADPDFDVRVHRVRQITRPRAIAICCELCPDLADILCDGEGAAPSATSANLASTPKEVARLVRASVTRLLFAVGEAWRPVVLFFDDLQWADAASMELIGHLTCQDNVRCGVVMSFRDTEVNSSHPLTSLRAKLARTSREHFVDIQLAPLQLVDVQDLLADTLGTPAADVAALADVVHAKTGGNPFFVRQFVERMYDKGAITFDFATHKWTWDTGALREAAFTANVLEFLMHGVSELPAASQVLLQSAACVGTWFDAEEAADLADVAVHDAAPHLAAAAAAGILQLVDGDGRRFRFAHDRLQEACHSMVAPERRRQLHLRIGLRLLATLGDAVYADVGYTGVKAGAVSHDLAGVLENDDATAEEDDDLYAVTGESDGLDEDEREDSSGEAGIEHLPSSGAAPERAASDDARITAVATAGTAALRPPAESSPAEAIAPQIFTLVNHLDEAAGPELEVPAEIGREKFVTLNLQAGKLAMQSAAFHEALPYLDAAQAAIRQDEEPSWSAWPHVCLDVFLRAAMCLFFCRELEEGERTLAYAEERVTASDALFGVRLRRAHFLAHIHRYDDAVAKAHENLREAFQITFLPEDDDAEQLSARFCALVQRFRPAEGPPRRAADVLKEVPETDTSAMRLSAVQLSQVALYAALADANVYHIAKYGICAMERMLKHGRPPLHCVTVATFAKLLSMFTDEFDLARELAEYALAAYAQIDDGRENLARFRVYSEASVVMCWSNSKWRELHLLREGTRGASRAHAIAYVGEGLVRQVLLHLAKGTPVPFVRRLAARARRFADTARLASIEEIADSVFRILGRLLSAADDAEACRELAEQMEYLHEMVMLTQHGHRRGSGGSDRTAHASGSSSHSSSSLGRSLRSLVSFRSQGFPHGRESRDSLASTGGYAAEAEEEFDALQHDELLCSAGEEVRRSSGASAASGSECEKAGAARARQRQRARDILADALVEGGEARGYRAVVGTVLRVIALLHHVVMGDHETALEQLRCLDVLAAERVLLGSHPYLMMHYLAPLVAYEELRRRSEQAAGGGECAVAAYDAEGTKGKTMSNEDLRLIASRLGARLAKWARVSPVNFAHAAALVAGAEQRCAGDALGALRALNAARAAAKQQHCWPEAGIAAELCASLYGAIGATEDRLAALHEALAAYSAWGASGKVRSLLQGGGDALRKYSAAVRHRGSAVLATAPRAAAGTSARGSHHPERSSASTDSRSGEIASVGSRSGRDALDGSRPSSTAGASTGAQSTGAQASGAVDTASVVKALALMSSQLNFVSLLQTLMSVAIENAGAERACLLLRNGGRVHTVDDHAMALRSRLEVVAVADATAAHGTAVSVCEPPVPLDVLRERQSARGVATRAEAAPAAVPAARPPPLAPQVVTGAAAVRDTPAETTDSPADVAQMFGEGSSGRSKRAHRQQRAVRAGSRARRASSGGKRLPAPLAARTPAPSADVAGDVQAQAGADAAHAIASGATVGDSIERIGRGRGGLVLCDAAVYAVARTRRTLKLADATASGPFASSDYIVRCEREIGKPVRSILVQPIVHHGVLTGVLYLENNALTGAFSTAKTEIMSLLSAQMASAISNAALFQDAREANERLSRLMLSYSRFVPRNFLSLLGKESIVGVHLGDHVQTDMTVVFNDIRSFTSLSERMTPEQNFRFLNSFLARVSPLIREYGGFIDKYIGDAIMALFPGSNDPLRAVAASVAMCHEVRRWSDAVLARDFPELLAVTKQIRVGFGIHRGSLILGTVGEDARMDTTVISDTVNLASRLEGLSKTYGALVIVSADTLGVRERVEGYVAARRAGQPAQLYSGKCDCGGLEWRWVGCVTVKGRSSGTHILEVLSADEGARCTAKEETRELFSAALAEFLAERYVSAEAEFTRVLHADKDDIAATYYLDICAKAAALERSGAGATIAVQKDGTAIIS